MVSLVWHTSAVTTHTPCRQRGVRCVKYIYTHFHHQLFTPLHIHTTSSSHLARIHPFLFYFFAPFTHRPLFLDLGRVLSGILDLVHHQHGGQPSQSRTCQRRCGRHSGWMFLGCRTYVQASFRRERDVPDTCRIRRRRNKRAKLRCSLHRKYRT